MGHDGKGTILGALKLLSDRDFARVWAGGAILGVVRWLEALAVGIFVFDLTGSASAVAFVGFMRMVPMALFGAVTGSLAGRFHRRDLLVIGSGIGGVTAAVLGAVTWAGSVEVWQIAAASFLTGVLWTGDFPIRRTLLADIAGPDRIAEAMALDSASVHATRLLGAGAGGLLVGSVGLEGAYLLIAALYGVVVLMLRGIEHADMPTSVSLGHMLRETVNGFRVIAAERSLVAVLAVTLIFNFFGFAYTSMVPVIGREALHADAFAIGVLASTEAAASLAATVLWAALAPRRGLGVIYSVGVLAFMVGVAAFALSPSYWLCLLVMAVTGFAWGGFSAMQGSLVLFAAPPAQKARAMGALVVCIGLAPLGMLHLGWMADQWNASTAVAVSATEGAIFMIGVMVLFSRILKFRFPF